MRCHGTKIVHGVLSHKKSSGDPPGPRRVDLLGFFFPQKNEVLKIAYNGEKIDQNLKKNSASVDGGLSGGSGVRRPGSEGSHPC